MQKKTVRLIAIVLAVMILGIGIYAIAVNLYIKCSVDENILSAENIDKKYDCIIILGCGVKPDKTPSKMLTDRLNKGIELYKAGVAPKILMSGDHSAEYYDEVSVMKEYAINAGVSSEDIFLDHAGFSSYESVYRAKEIFGVKSAIFVSQEYHLYRVLYMAESFNINAVGCAAEKISYSGQALRDIREVIARNKDFLYCIFKPKPTYLGEKIDLSANGDITN